MLKWIFILLFLGIGLSVFLQYKLQQVSGPVPTTNAVLRSAVPEKAWERGAATVPGKKKLSTREERLSNRVAPVREAPIKDDILVQ